MIVGEVERAGEVAVRSAECLRGWRSDFIEFVQTLALAESPSTVPESQSAVREILQGALLHLGFEVDCISGDRYGDHLLAQMPGSAVQQMLLGHLDTVWPVGTLNTMPVQLDGDILRGPGIFDMKGGLAIGIFALRALEKLECVPPLVPGFLITAEEEIGSPESEPLIIDLAKGATRVFVLEPALGERGRVKTFRKGVGHFHVEVTGVSSHAGLSPDAGASAVVELANVIQSLTGLADPERGITVNVGVISGGTRANVVAARATGEVDVRVKTVEDAREIEVKINRIVASVPRTRVSIKGMVARDPLERTPRNQALWERARGIATSIGVDLEEGESGGASDGNLTSQYTATLDGLGAVGDGAHADHEFLHVDKTLDRVAILAGLLTLP